VIGWVVDGTPKNGIRVDGQYTVFGNHVHKSKT
jgi:hypothetical protein